MMLLHHLHVIGGGGGGGVLLFKDRPIGLISKYTDTVLGHSNSTLI